MIGLRCEHWTKLRHLDPHLWRKSLPKFELVGVGGGGRFRCDRHWKRFHQTTGDAADLFKPPASACRRVVWALQEPADPPVSTYVPSIFYKCNLQFLRGRTPDIFGDKFGTKFVTKFGDKFGDYQIWCKIWWQIWWQNQWAPVLVINLSPNLVSYLVTYLVFTKFGDKFVTE